VHTWSVRGNASSHGGPTPYSPIWAFPDGKERRRSHTADAAGTRRRRLASWEAMSSPRTSRHPVEVTHLPVVRCQVCQRTVAYRPGQASAVLTRHYVRAHPEALDID
jgi:hypothetical protein